MGFVEVAYSGAIVLFDSCVPRAWSLFRDVGNVQQLAVVSEQLLVL